MSFPATIEFLTLSVTHIPAFLLKRNCNTFLLVALLLPAKSLLSQQEITPAAYLMRPPQSDKSGESTSSDTALTFSFEYYIELLNCKTPVELAFNGDVEKYINLYLTERRSDLELALKRAQLYFPLIEEQLDRYDIPLELKYIAVLESGLNPFARSTSGAVGLWQFMYNTCSMVGLKIDSYLDERRDPYKSTDAACRYLKYLYTTFNDWNLVMAGYNGGPRDVRNAIECSGGKTNYWDLRPYLSEQARNYVPKFIALNYVMNYHSLHGIEVQPLQYSYAKTDTLHIQYAVSFDQICSFLDITVAELERLNPVYKKKFIPDLPDPCTLVLPSDQIIAYLKFENQILGYDLPVSDYNYLVAIAGSTLNRIRIIHTVQPGEYFHKIALTYNCTIENIKAWNDLDDSPLHTGQSLTIWIEKGGNDEQ